MNSNHMNDHHTIERIHPVPHRAGEIFLAGGCFWGTEEYLGRVRGVVSTDVGYANSRVPGPTYEQVCQGAPHAAETVRVVYDPAVLPLGRLLEIFFQSIDPCAVNRQGGDVGAQYRTGIYYVDEADRPVIAAALESLAATAPGPIAVEHMPLENYWAAEERHQQYLKKNPGGYCHIPQRLFGYAGTANEEA